jgi:hypothetical protein
MKPAMMGVYITTPPSKVYFQSPTLSEEIRGFALPLIFRRASNPTFRANVAMLQEGIILEP